MGSSRGKCVVSAVVTTKTYFTSLHTVRSHGYVPGMSGFDGNNPRAQPLAIAIVCVAQFVVVLDVTIVTTALPAIRQGLGFTDTELQWVFTAYALVSGGLLICGGRIADVAGRRRTFLVGLGLFSAASAACAVAWSPEALVAGRVLQGFGAALLSPAALAVLTTLSEPGEARRRAVGWWTAVAAGGGASGWVVGGLITENAGWRWVFAVNVPIGLIAHAIAPPLLRPDRQQTAHRRLDLGGAMTATTGLALLVFGLTSAGDRGLGRVWSWLPLLLGGLSFVIFGVALLLPLAATRGLDSMTGYRFGFAGAAAIALAGALAGLLVPPTRSLITSSSSGVVSDASARSQLKGNDHHDHARSSRGARG
jgi:MFS family permease